LGSIIIIIKHTKYLSLKNTKYTPHIIKYTHISSSSSPISTASSSFHHNKLPIHHIDMPIHGLCYQSKTSSSSTHFHTPNIDIFMHNQKMVCIFHHHHITPH
jgi:hypothetical protein